MDRKYQVSGSACQAFNGLMGMHYTFPIRICLTTLQRCRSQIMPYTLKENEIAVPTMFYTELRMVWGNLVAPQAIRAQTWLKMSMLPDYFTILEAKMLVFGAENPARISFPEIHMPVRQILAFHLLPPFEMEPDFDPNEPNRDMFPVTAVIGVFRFDGKRRLSTLADFGVALEAGSETFHPFYDVTISQLTLPSMKGLTVPYALLRANATTYGIA